MLAFALRLLLCLSLVLNGAGAAVASAHMHGTGGQGGADAVARAVVEEAADVGPCHDAAMAEADGAAAPVPPASVVADTAADPRGQECCASGACQCICTPATQAVPRTAGLDGPTRAGDAVVDRAAAAHIPPALGLLIRPPIG